MKKYLLIIIAIMISINVMNAQVEVIDNKGNRNQTYPSVTETNSTIVEMLRQVDTVNLYNTIDWMQQYVRDATMPEALITQNYLLDRFEEIGLDTYIHNHTATIGGTDTLEAGNIIAVQLGTEFPDEYIIISSHYDHPDGPGADDNASGTAGVLECARILSQYEFKRTILYIPFNGEESWMVGSYPFAQRCARENMNILGVFNLDMIGFWPGPEYGDITMYSGYSYISENLFKYYQSVANLYIPEMPTYRFTEMDSYGGDHMPFNIYEYPALYIGDLEYQYENIHYHKPSDTIGAGVNCFALAQGFVKATIAAAAELANGWLAPQDFSAIVKDGEVFLSWNEAPETVSYKLFKDDELLTETSENSFVDKEFIDNEWHRYYVKGIHADGKESPASNPDSVFTRQELQLPVFYDFENDTIEGLFLNNKNWSIANWESQKVLAAKTYTHDNILQIIETQWFSVPDSVENLTLGLKIKNSNYMTWLLAYNGNAYVEVTTDRKTWHKLAIAPSTSNKKWKEVSISLNDFIGHNYVQARIRDEGSGKGMATTWSNTFYIDDLFINFEPISDTTSITIQEKFNLSVSPNPSDGIVRITSGWEREYSIAVYNILGVKLFSNDHFSDGTLDLNFLPAGTYFISINNGVDRISKRIVVR